MTMVRMTKQQFRAKSASECFAPERNVRDEYRQFAKRFPALVHSCGIAQAIAFAQAKDRNDYLDDLAGVMGIANGQVLGMTSLAADMVEYQQKTREAIECATWIKRYAEATENTSEKPKAASEKV